MGTPSNFQEMLSHLCLFRGRCLRRHVDDLDLLSTPCAQRAATGTHIATTHEAADAGECKISLELSLEKYGEDWRS